jgi:hypothetical protein
METRHGATLNLVGGMIATVAFCLIDDREFAGKAEACLRQVREKLPAAVYSVDKLIDITTNPDPKRVNEALAVLPFNYH